MRWEHLIRLSVSYSSPENWIKHPTCRSKDQMSENLTSWGRIKVSDLQCQMGPSYSHIQNVMDIEHKTTCNEIEYE